MGAPPASLRSVIILSPFGRFFNLFRPPFPLLAKSAILPPFTPSLRASRPLRRNFPPQGSSAKGFFPRRRHERNGPFRPRSPAIMRGPIEKNGGSTVSRVPFFRFSTLGIPIIAISMRFVNDFMRIFANCHKRLLQEKSCRPFSFRAPPCAWRRSSETRRRARRREGWDETRE